MQEASREATVCLEEQTASVRAENRELRRRLLAAINTGKSLQEREQTLQRQQRSLQQQAELSDRVVVARLTSRPSVATAAAASPETTSKFRRSSSNMASPSTAARPGLSGAAVTAAASPTAAVTASLSRLSVNPPGPRPPPPSTGSPTRVGSAATRSLAGRF